MKKKMGLVQLSENDLKGVAAGGAGIPCDEICAVLCDATGICRDTGSRCTLLLQEQRAMSMGSCPLG